MNWFSFHVHSDLLLQPANSAKTKIHSVIQIRSKYKVETYMQWVKIDEPISMILQEYPISKLRFDKYYCIKDINVANVLKNIVTTIVIMIMDIFILQGFRNFLNISKNSEHNITPFTLAMATPFSP